MKGILPKALENQIIAYIKDHCKYGELGWPNASGDEDTLTGDFFGSLRVGWQNYPVRHPKWQWRIDYRKFRGRGKNAFENQIGADGIIQIKVNGSNIKSAATKGLLFQAKKAPLRQEAEITEQVNKMVQIAPLGSSVFLYSENGYKFISASEYLQGNLNGIPMCTALEDFLTCKHGLRDLYFDFDDSTLHTPNRVIKTNEIVHALSVEVQ